MMKRKEQRTAAKRRRKLVNQSSPSGLKARARRARRAKASRQG